MLASAGSIGRWKEPGHSTAFPRNSPLSAEVLFSSKSSSGRLSVWSYLGMLMTALYVPHQWAFWCRLAGVDSTVVLVVLSVMVQVIPKTNLLPNYWRYFERQITETQLKFEKLVVPKLSPVSESLY